MAKAIIFKILSILLDLFANKILQGLL